MVAPPVVWRPDETLLRESNVARFMSAEHVADFPTLLRRSIDEPAWFWDAVVRFLDLPFVTPYDFEESLQSMADNDTPMPCETFAKLPVTTKSAPRFRAQALVSSSAAALSFESPSPLAFTFSCERSITCRRGDSL